MGKIIGLSGTYCAGKNYIARLLEKRGLPVLDVDRLGHEAIRAEKAAIVARFGEAVLGADGEVDRRILGERVFGKPEELAALEAIVHPAANRMTDQWIAEQGGNSCVINAALLHKSSAFPRLDCLILVRAPFFTRLLRARKRDKLPWITLLKRFKSQQKFTPQYLSGKADIHIVDNRGYHKGRLENRIEAILSGEGMH
jgi:dephospho-CoA kinase